MKSHVTHCPVALHCNREWARKHRSANTHDPPYEEGLLDLSFALRDQMQLKSGGQMIKPMMNIVPTVSPRLNQDESMLPRDQHYREEKHRRDEVHEDMVACEDQESAAGEERRTQRKHADVNSLMAASKLSVVLLRFTFECTVLECAGITNNHDTSHMHYSDVVG